MQDEYVVYTRTWFRRAAASFSTDILRSIAFGLIMFLSFAFLIFLPLLAAEAETETGLSGVVVFLFGCPAAVFCWWLSLKIAEDPSCPEQYPTIWDDQPVRWLESTVRFAHYLESQGKPIDMGLVLSDDVRSEAHRLIEQTDEAMVRAFLAAWLAASSNRTMPKECHVAKAPRLLSQ
ncbi:MAG: hypothetical protein IH624_15550 [Phycisphaerae bacterium]|nr:hypothetical protein [Phycisphaerae bacterium]